MFGLLQVFVPIPFHLRWTPRVKHWTWTSSFGLCSRQEHRWIRCQGQTEQRYALRSTLYAPRNMNELLPEEENRKDLLCEWSPQTFYYIIPVNLTDTFGRRNNHRSAFEYFARSVYVFLAQLWCYRPQTESQNFTGVQLFQRLLWSDWWCGSRKVGSRKRVISRNAAGPHYAFLLFSFPKKLDSTFPIMHLVFH